MAAAWTIAELGLNQNLMNDNLPSSPVEYHIANLHYIKDVLYDE
jgi:hypothetical protein